MLNLANKQCSGTPRPKQKSAVIRVITATDSQTSYKNTGSPWAEGPGLKGFEHMSKDPRPLVVLPAMAQSVLKKSLTIQPVPG